MSSADPEPVARDWSTICGRALVIGGVLTLPIGVGAIAGYWASDRGVRWQPTMLEAILVGCVLAALAIVAGQALMGRHVTIEPGRRRVRRRVIVALAVAASGAALRLGVQATQAPTPLTQITPDRRVRAFELDRASYREHSAALEGILVELESAPWARARTDAPLARDEEELLRTAWRAFYDHAFALDQVRMFHEDWYRFDSARAERRERVSSFLLTYACELALYEKGARLAAMLDRSGSARRFLDAPQPDLGPDSWGQFRQDVIGSRDVALVVAGESYLAWLEAALDLGSDLAAWDLVSLHDDVEGHLRLIDLLGLADRTSITVASDLAVLQRSVRRAWFPAQESVARWMGDVRVRRPGWYLITPEQTAEMARSLEPGDILLSRKNWYLSNVGLPGLWPHAILYVGSPEELEGMHLTDGTTLRAHLERLHPAAFQRYVAGSSDGPFRVIEAVSEGVIPNTLHGAAGDYLAAVRPRVATTARARAIANAFGHLGKPYDFDFDFATDHALVCTELVWRSYRSAAEEVGLELPVVRIAGRPTLPANEIARLFARTRGGADPPLAFVYFLDAREGEGRAVIADAEAFAASAERSKWDIAQE